MDFFPSLPNQEKDRILKNLDYFRKSAVQKAEMIKQKESANQ